MDKYVSANKLKAKVISGEPVLFNEPTQHEIFFLLELEPSEDVKPVVHAHWNEDEYGFYSCSNCGYEWDEAEYKTKYCPECGAKMDEPQESENKE